MNTPDLFTVNTPADSNTVDTVFITHYYLQRPLALQHQTMARWFASAHKLDDHDFSHLAGSQAIKIAIVNKGYNKLPIGPLHQYNLSQEDPTQRRRVK
jgi:hypothetical protein